MSGYKKEYTRQEDHAIIDYIVKNKGWYQLRGVTLWKEMENSPEFERSWQSLKNRFQKKIYPNLHLLDVEHSTSEKIRIGYQSTESKPKRKGATKERCYDDILDGSDASD